MAVETVERDSAHLLFDQNESFVAGFADGPVNRGEILQNIQSKTRARFFVLPGMVLVILFLVVLALGGLMGVVDGINLLTSEQKLVRGVALIVVSLVAGSIAGYGVFYYSERTLWYTINFRIENIYETMTNDRKIEVGKLIQVDILSEEKTLLVFIVNRRQEVYVHYGVPTSLAEGENILTLYGNGVYVIL